MFSVSGNLTGYFLILEVKFLRQLECMHLNLPPHLLVIVKDYNKLMKGLGIFMILVFAEMDR